MFEDETDCEPELTDEGKMWCKKSTKPLHLLPQLCRNFFLLPENGMSLNMLNICLLIALAVRYSEVAHVI